MVEEHSHSLGVFAAFILMLAMSFVVIVLATHLCKDHGKESRFSTFVGWECK